MEPTPGDPVNVHAAWRLAVAGRPRHAGNAGIAALTVAGSVGDLAEAHSGASLSEFRATLQEHRRSIGPPPAFR